MFVKTSSVSWKQLPSVRYLKLSIELVKAKQTALLVYTGIMAYLVSVHPIGINFRTILLLSLSLFLAISGSTLLNMYCDRDIDAKMDRTKNRPIPSGKVSAGVVLNLGMFLAIIGTIIAYWINLITMIVIFLGMFFDVGIYSLLLKRRTKWSIVVGGVAGGLPVLAGRTAALNSIDTVGILFFIIVLLWIPIHILSLATLPINMRGYSNANVPMWPLVSGVNQTRMVIAISAILEVTIIMITGIILNINHLTQIPLFVFGIVTLFLAIKNIIRPTHRRTFRIFKLASIYMVAIFLWFYVAVAIS